MFPKKPKFRAPGMDARGGIVGGVKELDYQTGTILPKPHQPFHATPAKIRKPGRRY